MRIINKVNNLYVFEKQVSNLVLGSIFFATFIYIPFLFARYGPIKLTVLSISASLILYYLIISKKLIKYKIVFLIFATNIFSLLLGFYFSDQKISLLLLIRSLLIPPQDHSLLILLFIYLVPYSNFLFK